MMKNRYFLIYGLLFWSFFSCFSIVTLYKSASLPVTLQIKNSIGFGVSTKDSFIKGFDGITGKQLEFESSPDTKDNFYKIPSGKKRQTQCTSGENYLFLVKTGKGMFQVILTISEFSETDQDLNSSFEITNRAPEKKTKMIVGYNCDIFDIMKITQKIADGITQKNVVSIMEKRMKELTEAAFEKIKKVGPTVKW